MKGITIACSRMPGSLSFTQIPYYHTFEKQEVFMFPFYRMFGGTAKGGGEGIRTLPDFDTLGKKGQMSPFIH
jgi:hypothetical protein